MLQKVIRRALTSASLDKSLAPSAEPSLRTEYTVMGSFASPTAEVGILVVYGDKQV